MKISFIGKFGKMHDEEYIARSLEAIGHEVQRLPQKMLTHQFIGLLDSFRPDMVLVTKFFVTEPHKIFGYLKNNNILSVSWTFDLYWGYSREPHISRTPGFKADRVFTTDGGHETEWKKAGIRHDCVRQGIYAPECYLEQGTPEGIVFVGSPNPLYPYRQEMIKNIRKFYPVTWYGEKDNDEVRGANLNNLYANTKIVIGDSVYSPYYWSNRVVETLGRGGFLIHQDVPGLKEEYPDLVTYEKGNLDDLKSKIDYYMSHEDERKEIVRKNFEHVKNNYTMDKKCAELISKL
jgi:hypothetical protein